MNTEQSQPSRRTFLGWVAAAGVAAAWTPGVSRAAEEIDPRVAKIVADSIGIDTHNHVDVPLTANAVPGPDIDLAGELKRSGLSAICMTFAVDYQRLTEPGQAYDRFLNGLTSMDAQLTKNKMQRALNFADLKAAHEKGEPIVVQSVEGALP
ncbi:MAG: hypothetical protein QM754_00805 [Tepidisphaeraceae bacterium]